MNGRREKIVAAGAALLLAVGVAAAPAGHPRHLLLFPLLWLLPVWTWAPLLPGTRLQRLVTAAALPLLLNPLLALLLHYLPGAPSRVLLLAGALLVALLPLLAPHRWKPEPDPTTSPPRAVWLALGGLLLAAALLRGANLGYKEFQGDEGVVLVRAAAALTGDDGALFLHQKGPLEILVPFLTWGTGGTLTELWARLPFTYAAVLGVAAVVALAAWWTRAWDRGRWPAALLAGAGLALAGLGVAFGRIVQYQSFVVLFGTLALLHAARYRDGGRARHLLLAALFLGGGLLAHYDAILVAPAAAWLLLPAFRRSPRRWLGALLAGGTVLALFYLPFALQPTFADTVGYLLNDRVGAGGGGWLSWTAPLAWEMGIFYLGIYYVVGFLLLLFIAALVTWRRPLRRLPAAAWLHLLVPLLFYTLVVVDPRTHIYTILPGGLIVAAAGGVGGWHALRSRPVRLAFGAVFAFLLLASGLYAALLFVQTSPERQRTWSENRPAGFPAPFEEPPLYGRFGFPYQAGWRVVPELLPEDAVWYASNEEEEVTAWYMAQRPRTFCPTEDIFLLARRVQDEVPFDPGLLETRHLRHQITVDGRSTLRLYQREPAGAVSVTEAQGRRLWRTPAEVAPPLPDPQVALDVELGTPTGPRARLLGYDLDAGRAVPGGQIVVTLYWQALTPFERNFQSFVHVYDGVRRAQHDGAPACDRRPTSGWVPGQIVADPHIVELPPEIPAGSFPLYAGLYDLLTVERLPVPAQPDNWIPLGEVRIGPE